jgi:hypothetical protein
MHRILAQARFSKIVCEFVPRKPRLWEERLKRETFERARALNSFAIPDDCDYLLALNSRPSRRH